MRRILCVAEKNDVAKSVAGILSNGHFNRLEGRSKFNKIYRFELDVRGEKAVISFTSVSGHLMNYQFGVEMKNWEGTRMASLFDAPIYHEVIFNMDKIEETLKQQASNSDTLIIWTDCDREGENIGAEIIKTCQKSKRNIDVFRAKFSEITPQAIHNAMRTLVRIDQRIVDAVDCRSELDLRIGAAFTRLQTLHLRNQFAHLMGNNNNGNSIASYGSCQFPTLGFIVERYKAIQEFIRETFWKLVIEHKRNGMKVEFAWDRVRLFNQDVVNVLYDDCKEARTAKVTKVATKPKSKWRPQPLDTVELEKLAVRKLRISAKVTMAIAEKLYNKGYISYPRTETNKFAPDIDLDRLVTMQTSSREWGDFATQINQRGPPTPRNGNKSDEAHPPIHPLKFSDRGDLQGQEWSVYELIVRHFLACVSWDATGKETRVDLVCGGEAFHATGLQISDLGYMNVYPYDKWSDKTIPLYVEGETLDDHEVKISDGQTQPPPLLNEADLISLMDKFGIGTDATHADHIDKIKERQYVSVQNDGRFVPGILGLGLVEGYDDMGFAMSKPHLRADLERQLQAICAGTRTKNDVLEEQKAKYRRIFEQSEQQVIKLSTALTRNLNNNQNRNLIVAQQQQRQQQQAAPQQQPQRGGRGGGARGGRGGAGTRGGRGGGAAAGPPHPNRLDSDDVVPFGGAARRGRGGRGATGATRGTRGGRGGAAAPPAAGDDQRQCQCGQPATQRTVSKEGQNKGKRFWTCAKSMTDATKCNFFEWA